MQIPILLGPEKPWVRPRMKTEAAATRRKFNNSELERHVPLPGLMFVFAERGHRMFPLGRGIAFLTHLLSPVYISSDSEDQVGINFLVRVVTDERLMLDYIPSVQSRTY